MLRSIEFCKKNDNKIYVNSDIKIVSTGNILDILMMQSQYIDDVEKRICEKSLKRHTHLNSDSSGCWWFCRFSGLLEQGRKGNAKPVALGLDRQYSI